jgi:hypothetical protein
MNINNLKNLEEIFGGAYDDVGTGGRPIQNLYMGIVDNNPNLSKKEAMETFLYFLEYLLRENLVIMYGAYDKKNDHEVKWEGSTEKLMEMLRKFIMTYPQEKLENDPVHFFDFKYCFLIWTIDWTEVLRRFDLKA